MFYLNINLFVFKTTLNGIKLESTINRISRAKERSSENVLHYNLNDELDHVQW